MKTRVSLKYFVNDCSFSFALKNCFFGTGKLTRNATKSRFVYIDRGIPFDGASLWIFDNGFSRNAVIFGVDNSSSSHTKNRKNNFWVLGEEPIYDVNDSVGTKDKQASINFTRTNPKFSLSLHYNGNESYLYVNKTKIYKFKAHDNIPWDEFCS